MHCEHLIVDDRTDWEVVEDVGEVLPDLWIAVLLLALCVEAIDLSDLSGFVVSTKKANSVWKS